MYLNWWVFWITSSMDWLDEHYFLKHPLPVNLKGTLHSTFVTNGNNKTVKRVVSEYSCWDCLFISPFITVSPPHHGLLVDAALPLISLLWSIFTVLLLSLFVILSTYDWSFVFFLLFLKIIYIIKTKKFNLKNLRRTWVLDSHSSSTDISIRSPN